MRLKIIHTNDLHSNFENFKKVATLIKRLRDDNTIVLDGGDFADFKSIELQGTRGGAALELLENVGYDAITIGNNEMFNGVDTLEYMASNSELPFISNNLYKKDGTTINGVFKSTIVVKNNLRILITGSSPNLGEFSEGLGILTTDYTMAVKEEIEQRKGSYDLCILLSHIGTFADEPLVEKIEGIDVVISAHDHKLYQEAKIVNNTIMNSAGNYGEHIGVVELEIVDSKVVLLHSETISTNEQQEDEEIISILQSNKEKAIQVLRQPLYPIQQPLWHDVLEENPLSNLIASGLQDMLNTDIGLINSGICNAGIFQFVSRKKLIEICPSPLNPTYFEIQGKYIWEALEQSLDAQICLGDGRGAGFRGRFAGRLHVSGIEITHSGTTIKEVVINGNSLDPEKWYSVASSDYLQRGSGYPVLSKNRNVRYLPEEIKDVIRLYACNQQFLENAQVNRWKEVSYVRG